MKDKDKIPSLFLKEFNVGKHKMLLPETDSISMAMVYNGKLYGGFVPVDYTNDTNIADVLNFLRRTANNQIIKLKNKENHSVKTKKNMGN